MSRHGSQDGFTIVELMIATTVLSVILLIATLVMTGIGRLYSKGINQSNIQDSARNIIDEVSQNLELSNGYTGPVAGAGGSVVYCVNSTRYTLVLGKQLSGTNDATHSRHVFWRDTISSGTCDDTGVSLGSDPASSGGTELANPNSRMTVFSISASSSPPYQIQVGEAYGDDDLLTALTGAGATCIGGVGGQFCAVSNLTTTVTPRIRQ